MFTTAAVKEIDGGWWFSQNEAQALGVVGGGGFTDHVANRSRLSFIAYEQFLQEEELRKNDVAATVISE